MSDDPRETELQRLKQRAEELEQMHQELRERRAEVAEGAADVHDEAARVHEELGAASLLDPEQLRAHADADRVIAAEERAALAAERGSPDGDQPD